MLPRSSEVLFMSLAISVMGLAGLFFALGMYQPKREKLFLILSLVALVTWVLIILVMPRDCLVYITTPEWRACFE